MKLFSRNRDVDVDQLDSDEKEKGASAFSSGDIVEAKFRGRGSRYYRGIIRGDGENDSTFDIAYDDGDFDHNLSAEHIRKVPLEKIADGIIEQTRDRGSRRLKRNARGIENDCGLKAFITKENVAADENIDSVPQQPILFNKGQRVIARYKGRGKRWYKGTIAECFPSENEYTIQYDDGDRDRRLSVEFIRAAENDLTQEDSETAPRDISIPSVTQTNNDDETSDEKDATSSKRETVTVASSLVVHSTVVMRDEAGAEAAEDSSKEKVAAKQQEKESTVAYSNSAGKGNRLYRGKVVSVKTVHLYEIEYPDSTTDTNIPFEALRLPKGFNQSDIKVGTSVDVLCWQDRFGFAAGDL